MEELATCLNSSLKEGFYEKAKHTTPAPVLVITTMPQRKGFGHDHEDHADHFPAVPEEKEDVSKEKLEVQILNSPTRFLTLVSGPQQLHFLQSCGHLLWSVCSGHTGPGGHHGV